MLRILSIAVFILIFFIQSTLSIKLQILHSPDSILLQNTNNSLNSEELTKFLCQCLGFTTEKPDWKGFVGYKNIAKNIPKSLIIFHSAISMEPISSILAEINPNSNIIDQYDETKNEMQARHENLLVDFVKIYPNDIDNSYSNENLLKKIKNYLKKMHPRDPDQPVFLWFDIVSGSKNDLEQKIEGEEFSKVMNHLKYLFGSDILVLSIFDENQKILDRSKRISENTRDRSSSASNKKRTNLAHEYSIDFHVSFVTIGFASLIFILAVFIISVSMWNIDPGRDSIIYRLTSQKIKKDQ
ncbi:Renin receptor [Sarcoptes scabiei]|uniref:Renin receptor n=1 Tax=Sarcoptes scabiei TaxID=52283 RepID=A0A834VCA4_SARSC|nr:Renin receptor [Sarcoptes scabiei]